VTLQNTTLMVGSTHACKYKTWTEVPNRAKYTSLPSYTIEYERKKSFVMVAPGLSGLKQCPLPTEVYFVQLKSVGLTEQIEIEASRGANEN
jgi:hypothetical protein